MLHIFCLVPIRHLPKPSRSMHFGDVSDTNSLQNQRGICCKTENDKFFSQNHQKSFRKRELIEAKFQYRRELAKDILTHILRKSYGQLVWSQFIASLVHFIIDTTFIQGGQGNTQLDTFCEVKSSLIRTLSGRMFQQFCRRRQHRLYLHDFMYLQYCKSFKIKLQ